VSGYWIRNILFTFWLYMLSLSCFSTLVGEAFGRYVCTGQKEMARLIVVFVTAEFFKE